MRARMKWSRCLLVGLLVAAACSGVGTGTDARHERGDARPMSDRTADSDAARRSPHEMELAPLVRLRATDPVLQSIMPWPREAEDAIATVRDDWLGTSWKAPAGESVMELGLVPLAGRPVELQSLSLTFDGAPPGSVSVYLLDACGLAGGAPRAWMAPDTPLDLAGEHAGCVRVEMVSESPFVLSDLSLVAFDSLPLSAALPIPRFDAPPPYPDSGVVEGFYGIPWSWRERRAMVVHLARLGLGTYIHAPKEDPRHRSAWRQPYDEEALARFSALAALGGEVGVLVMEGISPFVDWGPDTDGDRALLAEKLSAFQAVGVRGFVLLADDIEFEVDVPVDAALGAEHAAVANELLASLRESDSEVRLWFVPTVYSDARADDWEGGLDYLAALAALDPSVAVMWTGPGTSNAALVAADFERVTSIIGRPPVLWENYWANDGGDGFVGRLPLAPYAARAPDVPSALQGIIANPLIQGSLSRLPVTTLAGYLAAPAGRSPQSARAASAQAELPFTVGAFADPERDAELLALVQALFAASTLGSPAWAELSGALDALVARLPDLAALPVSEAATLLPLCARLVTVGSEIRVSGLAADLDDELLYPLRKVRRFGETCVHSVLALGDRLAGDPVSFHWPQAQAALEQTGSCRYQFNPGQAEALVEAVAAVPCQDLGSKPVACDAPFPGCRAAEEVQWTPCGDCPHLTLAGLPGAHVDGATVRWTPLLAGRYRVAATCTGPEGWGAALEEFECKP